MSKAELLLELREAVLSGDEAMAREKAKEALDLGIAPLEALEQGLSAGMELIGSKFEKGEAFLPELLMAADTFSAAMEILKPAIESSGSQAKKKGRVVLATVKGDVHNLGKNIVATVLETNGFEVHDLGVDQNTLDIIEAAKDAKADVIGLSAVMTTTMPYQKELIDTLGELHLRDQFVVLVGGGPVSQEWADKIGADGYGATAIDAVQLAAARINAKRGGV